MKKIIFIVIASCLLLAGCAGQQEQAEPTPTPTPTITITPTLTPTSTPTVSDINVKIYRVHYNAAGNDHHNLNGEYVIIKNYGESKANLKEWKLKDEYGHTYLFPYVKIPEDGTITVYTGLGEDTQTKIYWGHTSWAVWNNDGDTAYLYNSEGELMDSYGW